MKHRTSRTTALVLVLARSAAASGAEPPPAAASKASEPERVSSVESIQQSGILPDRVEYLRSAVTSADLHESRTLGPTTLIVLGSVGLVTFGVFAALPPFHTGEVIALGSSGFVVGGGVFAALSDEDYRKPIANATLLSGLGGLAIASATVPSRFMQESGSVAIAAGSFSSAALVTIGAAAHRRPVSRLRQDREELETNVELAPLSAGEVRRIEQDLREMDPVIPDWITYAPLLVGGAVACVPAIAHGFSDAAENGGAGFGALTMLIGGVSMVHVSYYDRYRTALHDAGVSDVALGPGPGNLGGLSISGRF